MGSRLRRLAGGLGLVVLVAAGLLWWWQSGRPAAGGRGESAVGETPAGAAATAAAGSGTRWEEGGAAAAPAEPAAEPSPAAEGGAPATIRVHVAGAVRRPGLYTLPAGARLGEAVEAAGGLSGEAAADLLNLAAVLVDGVRVTVPTRREAARFPGWPVLSTDPGAGAEGAAPAPPARAGGGSGAGTATTGGAALLDLNRASAEELDRLPGIGPARAAAIVALRQARGGFRSVDELLEVRGIGPALLEELRALVRVGPP